ncbi:M23 family metallopeptidase [Salinibacterium sp. SYSU T00001]|uniref:M23 family metallopeptidase n=1 Tax=Homoserinimonas sedimenticola TaxID=2986805 RepID=UPI002236356C|nr:M23 family metallopeptidase [Salinibacterium sedimenticola]MCW4385982.1 M23 family metallopeptidase [Salinibacterium sedimenticola]
MTPSLPSAPSLPTPLAAQVAPGAEEFPLRRARREAEKTASTKRVAGRRKPAITASTVTAGDRPAAAPRSTRRPAPSKRRILAQLASLGAMAGVFALLVSTSLPASAFYTAEEAQTAAAATEEAEAAESSLAAVPAQEVMVNAEAAAAATETEALPRDSYEVKSFQQQITALRGNPNFAYTNNPNGSIQWPFPGTVPISSGFGPRSVCSYCSTYHLGVDFTPGSGVPIQAITDGVVSSVNLDSGGLGNHVTIDHVVNGQRVQSVYAHMQWGSIQVAVGQQVTVGTIIGKVGSTGTSTGAHLHLEIHLDGTPVDPFMWLTANAN